MSAGPEIWFYHLERSTLDQVLPGLLEKTRERGWRALVRAADERLLEDIELIEVSLVTHPLQPLARVHLVQ